MSADLLLRAAAKLREGVRAASDGPWTASCVWSPDSHATSAVYSLAYPTGTASSEIVPSVRKGKGGIKKAGDANYFALMHPPVALALADWLDIAAKSIEARIIAETHVGVPDGTIKTSDEDAAIAVARAVLREDGESA